MQNIVFQIIWILNLHMQNSSPFETWRSTHYITTTCSFRTKPYKADRTASIVYLDK